MDRIDTDGTTHAMDKLIDDRVADAKGKRRGKTACGRIVLGATGVIAPTGISCKSCKRVLRGRGWRV